MVKKGISIATATQYDLSNPKDQIRADLAKITLHKADLLGYNISLVDGGSPEHLLDEFRELGAKVIFEPNDTMGESRRRAINDALSYNTDVVAWLEPEKHPYIEFLEKTANPLRAGEADIVIPKRVSMASYPTAQQHAEPLGNAFWKELTKTDLDVWFGPRTWNRAESGFFTKYQGEHGDKWDSIFVPVADAVANGRAVKSVEINYIHPSEQKVMEENDPEFYQKRTAQLDNIMTSIYEHWINRA